MNKKPINSNPTKEFFNLLKTIEKLTKNQARISSYNPDDISSFIVEICPIKGVYQHAKFVFQIQLMLYPREFPNVICLSDIYHPNIEHGEDYHNVCLNLFDNWNRSFGLIDVIQGLIFLLYQPNIHDPISSLFNSRNTSDEIFRKNVYTSLHGGVVAGVKFLPNPGIIEYNESKLKSEFVEQKDSIIEEKRDIETVSISNEQDCINIIDGEPKKDCDEETNGFENDLEWINLMRNNSAAQDNMIEYPKADLVNFTGEIEDDLPTRDILSPNAFYSDLICSRYEQSEKLSDSEYGSNEIYQTSIVFDLFGFPPSTYASAESERYDAYDSYDDTDLWQAESYADEEEDIFNNNYDEEYGSGDRATENVTSQDLYLPLSVDSGDPSFIFLTQWLQTRRLHNLSTVSPAPMTSVILTNVLNPFREIIGTFYLFGGHRRSCQRPAVHMIGLYEYRSHMMAWLTNICRWCMVRHMQAPLSELGSGQLLFYSLYVTLFVNMRTRLANIYNYGSDNFDCVFIK